MQVISPSGVSISSVVSSMYRKAFWGFMEIEALGMFIIFIIPIVAQHLS